MNQDEARQKPSGLQLMLLPERVEARLWIRRGNDPDGREAVSQLFDRYRHFAEKLARQQFARRRADNYEVGDLVQLAYEALVQAITRFDPSRAVPFEAYARRRILGHISNGLAKFSEAAAQYSFRHRSERERLLSLKLTGEQLRAGDPLTALSELSAEIAMGLLLEQEAALDPLTVSDPAPSAYETLAWNQLLQNASREMDNLPEREAFVIRQHYSNGVSFKEIAVLLGVTKGRISQLHKAALQRMRGQLGNAR